MVVDKKWREFLTLAALSIAAWFILINFNERVGQVYGIGCSLLLTFYLALLVKFPNKIIPIETEEKNRLIEIIISVGAYVAFIVVAGFIAVWLNPSTTSYVDNVNALVGETFSATPVLFGSPFLKLITWGNIISKVETILFFTVLLSLILTVTKYSINSDFKQGKTWLIMLAISLVYTLGWVFMVFHSEAKGILNNSALIVTFIFGVISLILIFWRKCALSAIVLHIITN
jgi:hypothetical protein